MTGPLAARMVKARAMALKAVVPGVPKSVKDRELLEEDLRRIGCHRFLDRPWGLQMEDMVVELLGDKDNSWHGTMHQAPEKWMAKEWHKVYSFGRGREGMASRTDRFIDGMFSGRVNPKDGYAVVDCKDPRAKRVLEFLVPLLYPEKAHESNYYSRKYNLRGFIQGDTGRLGNSGEGSSIEATIRDGEVQGNADLPVHLPPLSFAGIAPPY